MPKRAPILLLSAIALACPAAVLAQTYDDLPPLTPMTGAELQALPPEYRTAPPAAAPLTGETYTAQDSVETIVRTRRIDSPRTAPAAPPAYAPMVLEPQQWLAECRRRTAAQDKDERYDCEGALNTYLSQPVALDRAASRSIPGAGSGYAYGYPYAAPPEMVLVRTEVPQQVVVRETERYETYSVPAPAPSPRPIKGQ